MKKITTTSILLVGLTGFLAIGCKPAAQNQTPATTTISPKAATRPAPAKVTFSDLAVPPKPPVDAELLARGRTVYAQNCQACHGLNGDGKGDAAGFLLPKPRNFIQANFRLRSTAPSHLPTDADLFRAVSLGMPGTPMPPWRVNLSDNDRWAVVEYIKSFSARFNDPKEDRAVVVSLSNPPARTDAAIAEGKALFTKLACITCHGEAGHGDGPSAVSLVDDSQIKIRPRDFSRTTAFKSGYGAKEIVRTILTGFNGTPMVGFHGTVSEQDAWKVAYYVETFARPPAPTAIARASQNFLIREELGEPDVRVKLIERAWKYDPDVIRVKKGQIVEVTFEPTDNGLGVGHGFAISGYDENVFLNGAMVGVPKTAKFRAERAGKFTYYCATQCSTEKLHPTMNGTLIVEDNSETRTASLR
ncbi:MAG TPA: c-type cytochrome [Patescibacteria group bacterium]|nr:c-type cytochrome [Patescibacteria group bacterium]